MGKPRKSIITNDTRHCFICGSPYVEIHHCIHGWANRRIADKYDLVVALCPEHHREVHDGDGWLDRQLKRTAQEAFETHYPDMNFREIFGKNFKED